MSPLKALIAVAASLGFITAAGAQELKIGLSAEPSAMDPHFHNLAPNHSLTKHMFDRLTDQDENQRLKPMLAVSWRTLNDTTWEFKLRPGVKFTDGSDFTANDVIYSFCRVPQIENSPSSMAINVRAITGMTAPDPLTLVVTTAHAHPRLPGRRDLSEDRGLPLRGGRGRNRAVQAPALHQRRPDHSRAERGLLG